MKTILKFFSFFTLILMCACGAPKRSTDTTLDTGSPDTSTPIFDTSTTSPTGTSTENLFSTQTGTQLQDPPQGSGTIQNLSQSETQCLTSNDAFSLSSYGAHGAASTASSPTSTSSSSCLNTTQLLQPDTLYDGAVTSYEAADYCLGEAASKYAPTYSQSQYDIQLSMQLAELGLIRCMRDIINYQQQLIPWANPQVAAFQHADHNVWYIGQGINYR